MRTICAWCLAVLKEGTGAPNEPVSHGACEECMNILIEEIREGHPEVADPDQLELGGVG